MSTLRNSKKKEDAFNVRASARRASSFASFKAFLARIKARGRQKLTIMLIPHTEKKVINIQLSFFAVGGILTGVALVFLAFVFSAARFSDTANKLQTRSSDLASTQASLAEIRGQTKELIIAARRFDSALSGSLGGAAPKDSSSPSAPAQPVSLSSTFTSGSPKSEASREVEALQRVTSYLQTSVTPLKSLNSLLQSNNAVLTEIPNIWPLRGAAHLSMYYGQNENPFTGQWFLNKGVDISSYRTGDAVLSTADGSVSALGFDPTMGNYIVVQHNHGFVTRYGHLMAFRVAKGQKVTQGQIIGLLGGTGLTTGPYLHYEVHLGSGVVDPVKFLNLRATAVAAD